MTAILPSQLPLRIAAFASGFCPDRSFLPFDLAAAAPLPAFFLACTAP
jgi:hypothetical protein